MSVEKWAIVTGASGGIGQEIVREIAAEGYSVYTHFHQNGAGLSKLAAELKEAYPEQDFILVQADLSQNDGVEQLSSVVHHPIECLIHNCGKSHIGLVQDVSDDLLDAFMKLQMVSPFRLTQRYIPEMVRSKKGKIIFITSVWGLTGAATEVLYSMVKGGQNSLVKALAKELAPSGISVNAVAPGAIRTPMLSVFSEDDLLQLEEDIPAGRLGTPYDVASLVRFLTTDRASYINGQIISVNGAWYC